MWRYDDQGEKTTPNSMAVNYQGYFVAGDWRSDTLQQFAGYVMKLDYDGQPIWKRRYGLDDSGFLSAVAPVSFWSGHAIVAGRANADSGMGWGDGWLTRIDDDGEIIWSWLRGGAYGDQFADLIRLSDGTFVAVGSSGSFTSTGKHGCWLFRFTAEGQRIGEMLYSGDKEAYCSSVIEIVDSAQGGSALMLAGTLQDGDSHWGLVLRLNPDGTVKWQRSVGPGAMPAISQILATNNAPDGFIVANKSSVLRLTDDGDLDPVWANRYRYTKGAFSASGSANAITRVSGGFVIGGHAQRPGNNDGWLMAIDGSGSPLWSRSYGGDEGSEHLAGVSGLGIVPGTRGIYGALWWHPHGADFSELDSWAFSADQWGRIPGCSFVKSWPVEAEPIDVEIQPTGLVAESIDSDFRQVKFLPPLMGGKDMKLCPLDCLYHVDEKSTAAGPDGKTWETAFSSLQEGIEVAAVDAPWSPQGRCEVWVAEGTYHAYQTSAEDSFALAYRVHMYGGFPGADSGYSDYFDDREWEDYQTILTGYDEGGTERVRHVVTGVAGADESVLDGFYVRDGVAEGTEFVDGAGAGLWLDGVSPEIRSCEITNNIAAGWGGGAAVRGGAPLFQDVRFVGNGYLSSVRTAFGGGVYNQDTGAVFRRCDFEDNRADYLGGAMATAMFDPAATAPMVLDSTFTMNEAQAGSAIVTYNDPATTNSLSAPFHVNLLVHGNSSTGWNGQADGSILTVGAGHIPSFVHCTVADNTGALLTGGLQAVESKPLVVNSIFWNVPFSGYQEIVHDNPMAMWVVHSDIQGGWSGSGWGNKNSDPQFPAVGYELQEGSPCIDSGFDLSPYSLLQEFFDHDLVGNTRPVTLVGPEQYDMGCYELQALE